MIYNGFPVIPVGYFLLATPQRGSPMDLQELFVFQWFRKDPQVVSIVWTGEEDPYCFLANSENLVYPVLFLGFPIIPVVIVFLPHRNYGFLLVLQGFLRLLFF